MRKLSILFFNKETFIVFWIIGILAVGLPLIATAYGQSINSFWTQYIDPANTANRTSLIHNWWGFITGYHPKLVMFEGDDTTRKYLKATLSTKWKSMWYQTFTTITSDPVGKPEHDSRNYPIYRYDSLKTYITAQSGDLESCFIHIDSNYAVQIGSTWYFQGGWSEANDVGGNNVRDKKGYGAFPVSHGLNYAVFSGFNWTVNSLVGMGLYTNEGRTLLDTVTSNTADTVRWNVGDTSNYISNAGFETGQSPWIKFGDSTINLNTAGARKIYGDSSRLIANDGNGVEYIRQKSVLSDSGWEHRFRLYYRTNTPSKVKLTVRKGTDFDAVMFEYIPPAANNNLATIYSLDTLIPQTHIVQESCQIMLGFEAGGSSAETLVVDSIKFYSRKGFLNKFIYAWQSPTDSARYGTVIDSFTAVNHTAIAYNESLSRTRFNSLTVWLMNPNYSKYQNFLKQYLPKWINYRASADGETTNHVMFDEVQGFIGQTGIPRKSVGSTGDSVSLGVNEYQGFQADTLYRKHLWRLMKKIDDTLALTHSTIKLIYNGRPDTMFLDSSEFDGVYLEGGLVYGDALLPIGDTASGLWTGCMRSDAQCAYASTSYLYNVVGAYNLSQWNRFKARNKLIFWDSQYNTWDSASADSFKAFETAVARYLVMTGNDSFSYFYPKEDFQYKTANVYDEAIYHSDFGRATDTIFVFQSGTDGAGRPYVVLARKLKDPLMDTTLALFIPRSNSSVSIGDQTLITINLTDPYFWLSYDGRTRMVTNSISLKQAEGAVLFRVQCQ